MTPHFEIAHILFIDVVGYSKMPNDEQTTVLEKLNRVILRTPQVRAEEEKKLLIRLPTGDGMALVFRSHLEAPVKCALEIAEALKADSKTKLRMGIHSGPVNLITDINKRQNIAGDGVNVAQRVMDFGDADHILVSQRVADDLAHYREWELKLHPLGEFEAKHGRRISISNFWTNDLGNPSVPEKVKRAQREQRRSSRRRTALASVLLVTALVLAALLSWFFNFNRVKLAPSSAEISKSTVDYAILANSIAVLPFESLSVDQQKLAAGLHDELVTHLARIKDLTAISQFSVKDVMAYAGKGSRLLSEIRKELRVKYVLEGKVRHDGASVILNVRLIDTAGGREVWVKPYERSTIGLLELPGELASDLAKKLTLILTPKEEAQLKKNVTDKLDSWIAYQQGREAELEPGISKENCLTAIRFYEKALSGDPKYVLARARLAFMQARLYQSFESSNEGLLISARANAAQALTEDDNCGEAHFARARCAQLDGDAKQAQAELDRAIELLPNDASLLVTAAGTQHQFGLYEDALRNYSRAAELGPREANIFMHYGYLLYETDHEADARRKLDRALSLEPKSAYFHCVRAVAEISWTGNIEQAKKFLDQIPAGNDPDGRATSARCTLAILERNFEEALRLLVAYQGETLPTVESGGMGEQQNREEAAATIQFYAGNYARADKYFASLQPNYERAVRINPQSASDHGALAILYGWMGLKEPAKAEAGRTLELTASEPMHVKRAYILAMAKAYARVSEPDLAWQQIEQFLALPPSGYSAHNFRLDPVWDALRTDRRFQKLIETKKP